MDETETPSQSAATDDDNSHVVEAEEPTDKDVDNESMEDVEHEQQPLVNGESDSPPASECETTMTNDAVVTPLTNGGGRVKRKLVDIDDSSNSSDPGDHAPPQTKANGLPVNNCIVRIEH